MDADRGAGSAGSSGVVEMGGGGIGRLAASSRGGVRGGAIFITGADLRPGFAGFRNGDLTTRLDFVIWRRAGRLRLIIRFALALPGGVRMMR